MARSAREGHAEAWRQWRSAMAGGKMHHAWIVSGPEGCGKAAFSFAAAAELVAPPDGLTLDAHPDVLHLQREVKDGAKSEDGKSSVLARNITTDQVRAMQRSLTTRPTMGPRRAVIINAADDLEPNAANALLKSLEEPPAGTFFLLVSHHPARLLPTIRSRCRILRFTRTAVEPFSDDGGDRLEEERHLVEALKAVMGTGVEHGPAFLKLAGALGTRPSHIRLRSLITLAQELLTAGLPLAGASRFAQIDAAYGELCQLRTEVTTFNYDPDMLVARIATLLSDVPAPIDARDG